MNDEVEIYVSNLPNNAPEKQIISYLSTAGPIKDYRINKVEERCRYITSYSSVHVIYYNIESAELARKYLGTRQFQGRDLKINYDTKRQNLSNVAANLNQLNQDDNIIKLLNQLSPTQKDQLLQYLSNLYKKQDQMVLDFFQSKPKVLESLLNKNIQQNTFNGISNSHGPTGYYSMTGMGI